MSRTKVLIDTNVLIALEDPGRTDPLAADFSRRCAAGGIGIYVHPATRVDFSRDANQARQAISASRMHKFPCLAEIPLPKKTDLEQRFGSIRSENDKVDVALLYALSQNVVDVLVSQDGGLHRRVKGTDLEERVLTLADAVGWLRALQDPIDDGLPLVNDVPAYSLNSDDPIFRSLARDYISFDKWWRERCIGEHRSCWVVPGESGHLGGIIVRKEESGSEADISGARRVLKLCTFKVGEQSQGRKVGELLLRKALWFAQLNSFDAVYLTVFPRHTMLIDLLKHYGFEELRRSINGEIVISRRIMRQKLDACPGDDTAALARQNYPRFALNEATGLYAIPVRWKFHQQLFPEAAVLTPLPLFKDRTLVGRYDRRRPGNTIRKVYVSRSRIGTLQGGDIAFFYQSKDNSALNSQSMTTVGIIEQAHRARCERELLRMTAGRSVYSETDLRNILEEAHDGVLVIDFILIRHLEPPIPLSDLVQFQVFNGAPPQSISRLPKASLQHLLPSMKFGFQV